MKSTLSSMVLKGYGNVAEQAAMLEALAERCGQTAAMNWLEYFLHAPSTLAKMPNLVLLVRRRSLKATALRVEAKLFAAPRWFLGSPNFLARAICRENLQWHDGTAEVVDGVRAGYSVAQD